MPRTSPLDDETVDRLRALVGDENTVLQPDLMADPAWPLRDPYWLPDDDTYAPSIAVHPASVDELQGILRIAQRTGIPVWTHSQGRNNAYGGSSARMGGSISISLRRMNRVLEVNEELAYAVVEPGVRWVDLDAELRARGSRLAVSVPDIGWGSVVGNSMDNGITYMPYGSDFAAPCGLEVLLANGELLRTGMGAMPDNPTWHLYKRGNGPTLDALFTQSNYGIVTKMGVWLMPRPEAYAPIELTIARDEDFPTVIDTLRELRLRNVLRGVPGIYNTLMAAEMVGLRESLGLARTDFLSREQIVQLGTQHGLGAWMVRAALWGDTDAVEVQLAAVRKAWGAIEGSQVRVEGVYAPDDYSNITSLSGRITAGIPHLDLLNTMTGPEYGHVDLSPVVPLQGHRLKELVDKTQTLVESRTGYNFGIGALLVGERVCAVPLSVNFDPRDTAEATAAFDLGRDLVRLLGELGYAEYRLHLHLMDEGADLFSWNDHAYRRFCETIKDAVDPNGILSPGRYGIWPQRYRVPETGPGSHESTVGRLGG